MKRRSSSSSSSNCSSSNTPPYTSLLTLLLLASSSSSYCRQTQAFILPTPPQQQQQRRPCFQTTRTQTQTQTHPLHTRIIIPSSTTHFPPSTRRSLALASSSSSDDNNNEKSDLQQLLEKDPKENTLLGYLAFVTFGLLALGVGTYKLGGPLMGLGFSSDANFYWDSAPSYALLLVYPPLFLLFPEARGLLFKTVVASFVVTAVIWAFPYEAIGWDPTMEHILITVAVPILSYFSYFSFRATKTYLEIVEEEEREKAERGE